MCHTNSNSYFIPYEKSMPHINFNDCNANVFGANPKTRHFNRAIFATRLDFYHSFERQSTSMVFLTTFLIVSWRDAESSVEFLPRSWKVIKILKYLIAEIHRNLTIELPRNDNSFNEYCFAPFNIIVQSKRLDIFRVYN